MRDGGSTTTNRQIEPVRALQLKHSITTHQATGRLDTGITTVNRQEERRQHTNEVVADMTAVHRPNARPSGGNTTVNWSDNNEKKKIAMEQATGGPDGGNTTVNWQG